MATEYKYSGISRDPATGQVHFWLQVGKRDKLERVPLSDRQILVLQSQLAAWRLLDFDREKRGE